MSHSSREIATLLPIYSMPIFPNFALAILTQIETDISIIPERSGREWYVRGRSGIICDNGILDDVTFIARNRHTDAYILNVILCQFYVSYVEDN